MNKDIVLAFHHGLILQYYYLGKDHFSIGNKVRVKLWWFWLIIELYICSKFFKADSLNEVLIMCTSLGGYSFLQLTPVSIFSLNFLHYFDIIEQVPEKEKENSFTTSQFLGESGMSIMLDFIEKILTSLECELIVRKSHQDNKVIVILLLAPCELSRMLKLIDWVVGFLWTISSCFRKIASTVYPISFFGISGLTLCSCNLLNVFYFLVHHF